jgi:antitoxin YefM
MTIMTATDARKDLFALIRQINDDSDCIVITSRGGNAVLMSEAEYNSIRETGYLLRSPANAKRLLASYESALRGEAVQRELIEVE